VALVQDIPVPSATPVRARLPVARIFASICTRRNSEAFSACRRRHAAHHLAALVVYIAIPAGIVLFALPRVSPNNLVLSSLFWGGLFGLVVYTIYDMTNYSLLRDWPLRVSLIDICWGVFLNATGTLSAAYLDVAEVGR